MSRELLQQALDALENHRDPLSEAAGNALREALAAPQPEPEKRIVWCTETDSACSTCPTLRIPCQAATQAAALNARVTVPREPTQEMIAAGEAVFRSYCFRHVNGAIPTYEAMIAAAPAPADWGTPHDVSGAPWGAPAPAVCDGGTCGLGGYCTNCPRLSAAPAVPDLKHKPTVQRLMDLARKFRSAPGDLYDGAYKELQSACYEALSAAPAVREPQDERIRWRDAVIKEAESALRTAEQEFADMPTWANVGHAAKKVTHALAVIAAHGIGGGGK